MGCCCTKRHAFSLGDAETPVITTIELNDGDITQAISILKNCQPYKIVIMSDPY